MDVGRLSYPACVFAGQPKIEPQDILVLRKNVFPEGLVDAQDALTLLEIHRSPAEKCLEWHSWFVETMTAFIVHHSWPKGSLDEINGQWLMATIAPEGVIESAAELDLLIHVIEVSRAVPDFLSAFAIDQLRIALATGRGAYAARREGKRQGISEQDVEYVVRILKGACNNGQILLTSRENRVLGSISRIVEGRFNHPCWRNMLKLVRERGVEETRRPGPWLRLVHSRPESVSRVA